MKSDNSTRVKCERLIDAYCDTAKTLLHKVKKGLGIESQLIPYVRGAALPMEGTINGVHYQIHGGGVSLSSEEIGVDVQLGDEDYAEAFDAWRLAGFARAAGIAEEWAAADEISSLLESGVQKGTLERYEYLGDEFYRRKHSDSRPLRTERE